jgi:hypothetical protein
MKAKSIAKAVPTQENLSDNTAIFARDVALSQLRTAIILLRNTRNSREQITLLQTHLKRLLDAPDETLWKEYFTPVVNCCAETKQPIKARNQLPIIQESLQLIGLNLDCLYVDKPEEKSWFLDWNRGKRARLFWTASSSWNVKLYLGKDGGYVCNSFDLDEFLTQIGVDRTWWASEW